MLWSRAPTQQIRMHDVMKGVTCYKDASEHDWVLQWEQWCPCPRWRAARCDQLDDSIQVWRPVVESAWFELSSSPQEGWGPLYQAQSAQAHLLTRVSASLLVALCTWSSPTQASISFSHDFLITCNVHSKFTRACALPEGSKFASCQCTW